MQKITASELRLLTLAVILTVLATADFVAASEPAGESSSAGVPRALLLQYLADPSAFTLIDARSSEEFGTSHISGAINVPHDTSADFTPLLPAELDAPIVVYCKTGKRAARLRSVLLELGYTNVGVLKPERVFWFDDMAVFNCGVDAASASPNNVTAVPNKGKTEVKE